MKRIKGRRSGGMVFAAILLLSAPAFGGGSGRVQGTVTAGGEGQDGVAVEVYLEPKKGAGGAPFMVTETRDGGRFTLDLIEGSYYFWARGKAPAFGPPQVTEYPRNPVVVDHGVSTVLMPLELQEAGGSFRPAAPRQTGLRGRAVTDGKATADVSVMVYGADADQLTGPGYAALVISGPDGTFQADLPPGAYRVAARKRRDGSVAGFLRPGDRSVEYPGNPVSVVKGRYVELGDLVLREVDPARLAAQEERRRGGGSPTRLAGIVAGPDRKPLAGQYVFIYRDQGMIGKPDLMTVTGTDGAFAFDLPGGGTYWIGARSTMGGPRQPGEMAGRLSGSPDSSVTVDQGTAKSGLAIRMEAVW